MENSHTQTAIFAGGCFWCLQPTFDKLPGVISTTVGYTGGHVANPTYEQVCEGTTGHKEAIEILFDPDRISYKQLLSAFWKLIDPTDQSGQFFDKGESYQTAIYYTSDQQGQEAHQAKKLLEESGIFDRPIVTQITPAQEFYPAEKYHQKYYQSCPLQYQAYHHASGRDEFQKKHWPKEFTN